MASDSWYLWTKLNELLNGAASYFSEITTARGAKENLNARLDDIETGMTNPTGSLVFVAHKTAEQVLTTDTWTKVVFETEDADHTDIYDLANSKFLPDVAGLYQLNLTISNDGSSADISKARYAIYKNGSLHAIIFDSILADNIAVRSANLLVSLNGTTDYIEIYAYLTATTCKIGTGTYVSGFLVKSL